MLNTKPRPTVYLAGPINGMNDAECMGWRTALTTNLAEHFEIRDPMARDYRGKELSHFMDIVHGDKKDIEDSDLILVNTIPGPSYGTAMEVFYAWTLNKPILVWCTPRLSPWVLYHSSWRTHSLKELEEAAIAWKHGHAFFSNIRAR